MQTRKMKNAQAEPQSLTRAKYPDNLEKPDIKDILSYPAQERNGKNYGKTEYAFSNGNFKRADKENKDLENRFYRGFCGGYH